MSTPVEIKVTAVPIDGIELGLPAAQLEQSPPGNAFINTGYEFLRVRNAGGAALDVKITVQEYCNKEHHPLHHVQQTIAAGATWHFGPFQVSKFNTDERKVLCETVAGPGLLFAQVVQVKIPEPALTP